MAAGGDRSAYLDARIGCLFVWGRGLPPEVHDSGQPREVPLLRGTGAADAAGGDSKAAAAATTSAAAAASAQPSEGPCTVKAVAWRQVGHTLQARAQARLMWPLAGGAVPPPHHTRCCEV